MARAPDFTTKLPQIAAICRRYGVRQLLLFGSALGSSFRSDSDLDLLVDFHPDSQVGLVRLGQLQTELETLLERRIDAEGGPEALGSRHRPRAH